MSIADRDRRLTRRAALHFALMKGDALAAARAWDRLRVSGAAVRPDEADAARAARAAVGHALRDARYRRVHDADRYGFHLAPEPPPPPRPSLLRRSRSTVGAIVAVGLVALLVLLYQPVAPGGLPVGARPVQTTALPTALAAGGRGRTSATIAPVVVSAQPTAVPTPATPAPVAVASPSAGTGAGTGTGAGVIPPKPEADDRFVFQVLDARSLKPLPGVCVTYGNECRADTRRTNDQGLWWIDFPRSGTLARVWRFEFWMTGYVAQARQLPYVPGELHETVEVLLQRAQ